MNLSTLRSDRCDARVRTARWRMAVLGLACALPVAAQPVVGGAGGGHVTRTVAQFTELEESVLKAQRERQGDALARLVGDGFEMIVAQEADAPVPREDWLEAAVKPGAGRWAPSKMVVHEYGDLAVVSLVLTPRPGRKGAAPLFVVDTWQRAGADWRLALRHVASTGGSRAAVPGDVPAVIDRQKKI